jgi:3-methyladenine DNA glycosylase AlkD
LGTGRGRGRSKFLTAEPSGKSDSESQIEERTGRPGARLTSNQILAELRSKASARNREGQARFGIQTRAALGISVAVLRDLARRAGKDHGLAQELWSSGIHEARILASMVDRLDEVTEAQMESWAGDFDSWDLVDQCCGNLFDKTPYAYAKAAEWAGRDEEFVKRAAFSLMAQLAVHDKRAPDEPFHSFLSLIEREAGDSRNFVKKAVNWALRGIGKRNRTLHQVAVRTAERMLSKGQGSARWIASDALRELRNERVIARIPSPTLRVPKQRARTPRGGRTAPTH